MALVAPRSFGFPIPGSIQEQARLGLEQPGLMDDVPARGRGWKQMVFKIP